MAEQWYYTSNGEQNGPVGVVELQRLAASGQLQPADLVWKEGMPLWMPAGETRGLFRETRPGYAPPSAAGADAAPAEVLPVQPAYSREGGPPRDGRRGPPRRSPARGMSTGAKIALFGGIAGGFVAIVALIVLVSLAGRQRGEYILHLGQGERNDHFLRFAAHEKVTINVETDHNTTIHLLVYDSFGQQVASDIPQFSRDCRVTFWPDRTEEYQIVVINQGPGFGRVVVKYN